MKIREESRHFKTTIEKRIIVSIMKMLDGKPSYPFNCEKTPAAELTHITPVTSE
jgi:hypothetical protein